MATVKDQYFGDVNDYRKYGILRGLIEGSQLRLGVCWLRTVNDGRQDGEFRQYLQRPERWRHHDPELYDALRRLLDQGWIERFTEDESPRDRRAYRLTSQGRRNLQLEVQRMRHLTKLATARVARREA